MPERPKREKAKRVKTKEEKAAEISQERAAPAERPPPKHTILTQCMKDPSFRTRVIYHLAKKLQ